MQRGFFISVEGIDGAGKSTHLPFIQEYLQDKGFTVIITREPGGTELGEKVRNLLLHTYDPIHPITELFLMFASRQELIAKVIAPNLEQGVCVIADRFIDASVAYQGYGRGIGADKLATIISLLEPTLNTDLTFLFDIKLDLAIARVSRNKQKDRIENESNKFFAIVQNAYHAISQKEPQRVKVINTEQSINKTQNTIARYLSQLISSKNAK